jgi:aryl-alcohol dehydrogenase-like predicted oxidoreductase
MKYRLLGKTKLRVSVIGLGTWQFGGEWGHRYTQSEVDAILDQAEACGINLIDTAECYGDHLSESLIGDYLSRRNRHDWIIATKFGHEFHGFMNRSWRLAPDEVAHQLERSLAALRIENIDLYQFHSGSDEQFQQPDLWTMLEQQKQAGKIRHLGVSISSKAGPLQAREAPSVGAEAIQVVFNRLERRAETDFLPYARQYDLGVLARVPLASGYLSGKYAGTGPFPKDDMRSTLDEAKLRQWLNELDLIRKTELPEGVPMAQWALAWALLNPAVSAVIPGVKTPEQVKLNAAASDKVH